MPLPSVFRSLAHRNYRLFFCGQLVSLIGTWMQTTAQLWLVYRLSGSGADLGLVGFIGQFPALAMGPWGGVAADTLDRRTVLVWTQTLSMLLAFTLAGLTFSGLVRLWHVYILAGCLGLVNGVDIPTRQSFVVELVGKGDLPNAIALNSSIFNAARSVGPAVAGLLLAWLGESVCFLLNGLSYLGVIAGLLAMRIARRPRVTGGPSPARAVVEGATLAWSTPHLRAMLVMVAVCSFMGMPYTVLLPIFAQDILHAGPQGLGFLAAASGVGATGAAISLAMRTRVKGLGTWVAGAAIVFGLSLSAFAFSRSLALSLAAMLAAGFGMVLVFAASNTLLQIFAPDAMRGRIMSLFAMTYMGMMPIGAMLAGKLADHLGPQVVVAAGGGVCVLAGILFGLALPWIRASAHAAQGEEA